MTNRPRTSGADREHLEELLDEALAETFPASDPVAMLQPAPGPPAEPSDGGALPKWLVTAIWHEDEAEVTEQWEATALTADEAIAQVTPRFRFPPHHVETQRVS
jgi:hypothetical protein